MLLILIAFALVLGIAFFQVVQGIFSALVMALLSILCAAIAFNYYEPLAEALSLYDRMPAYADMASLIVLFVLPLLTLRIIFDRFLHQNDLMPTQKEKAGIDASSKLNLQKTFGNMMSCTAPWSRSKGVSVKPI